VARESLRVAIKAAAERLTAAGVPSPQADAEELAAWSLGIQRTRLGLHPLVESGWVEHYQQLIDRREQRIPLQHIIGSVRMGKATVQVGPGVFIPRPETELLVDWALAGIRDVRSPVVVDLCTGSGVVALAIAAHRPDARVIAVEREAGALAWARRNLEFHLERGGSPVELRGGDITDPRLLFDLDGLVDLVTANPPYVPAGTPVDPEVGVHDPPQAVFAGVDGLDLIRPLVSVAAAMLKPGGLLAIEHDDSHGETVPAMLQARRVLDEVADHPDLAARPRFVTARRVTLPDRPPDDPFR